MYRNLLMILMAALALSFMMAVDACGGGLDATGNEVEICDGQMIDPYSLDRLEVDGDDLLLTVNYGGGCESHHFQLCWDEVFEGDEPPEAHLFLTHDGHGDTCEAEITEDLAFDLTPVWEAWMAQFDGETGVVSIVIDEMSADYTF